MVSDVMTTEPSVCLRPEVAAAQLGVSKHTLRKWRAEGRGPDYVRINDRGDVRYRAGDLASWLEKNLQSSDAK